LTVKDPALLVRFFPDVSRPWRWFSQMLGPVEVAYMKGRPSGLGPNRSVQSNLEKPPRPSQSMELSVNSLLFLRDTLKVHT
jgi:hypothetical protein